MEDTHVEIHVDLCNCKSSVIEIFCRGGNGRIKLINVFQFSELNVISVGGFAVTLCSILPATPSVQNC